MSTVPYEGSKISLITKSQIRYEGILTCIDAKELTVALAKVRLYGTEGRPTERPYAPRDEIYEYIIFKSSDITDICVCEQPNAHAVLPHDPAIVRHSPPVSCFPSVPLPSFGPFYGLAPLQKYSTPSSYSHIPSHMSGHYSGNMSRSAPASYRKSPTSDAGVQVSVGNENTAQDPRIEARNKMRQRTREGIRNFQTQQRQMSTRRPMNDRNMFQRRGRGRGAGPPGTLRSIENLKYDNDYDFEQANAEFQELESKLAKNKIDESVEKSSETEDVIGFYDRKKSFFDDISCEATERIQGYDWRIERKLNVETFGASANNAWLRRRRGRGGYRRGFRSRGAYTRSNEMHKTVTFDETVKEVPILEEVSVTDDKEIGAENKPEIPIIEITVEKENAYLPESEAETVWK